MIDVTDRFTDDSERRDNTRRRRPGFTLIEMVIVLAIVIILLAVGLPAAQNLWKRQRESDSINLIEGMLKTTRALAIQGGKVETGLFFFVDDDGVQHAAAIRRADPTKLNAQLKEYGYTRPFGDVVQPEDKTRYLLALQNVFEVIPERVYSIPAPNRVVPRYVVDPPGSSNTPEVFSDEELANDTFETLGEGIDNNQRQRNFFTMIFTPTGALLPGRDVLILDIDTVIGPEGAHGDVTGLAVGYDAQANKAVVDKWYIQNSPVGSAQSAPLEPVTLRAIPFLVNDAKNETWAINVPSVDGLLLYDNDLFNDFTDPANKRDFLLRTAQPLYVNRLNGGIVRGPINENPVTK